MNRGGQIVTTTHVPEFMSEDGIQVRVGKALGDSFRPYQYRFGDAENPRFQRGVGHKDVDGPRHFLGALQPAQGFPFAAITERRGFANGCANAAPTQIPDHENQEDAAQPRHKKKR